MKEIKEEKEKIRYEIKDFYLAAYLLCKGGVLVGSKKSKDGRGKEVVVFLVESEKDLDEELKNFLNDKALVNPREYKSKLQDLKGVIYKDSLRVE